MLQPRVTAPENNFTGQHETLFQLTPNFVCVATTDGLLEETNPAWSDRLGLVREDWQGRPIHTLVDPLDRAEFQTWWHGVVSGTRDARSAASDECEIRVLGAGGRVRYVNWTATLSPADGKVYAYGHDTTERRVAEASLRESEARFRAMADSAPVLIWIADVNQSRTYCNRPWLNFTGRQLADELGQGWLESIHPDDRARCLETYSSGIASRSAFKLEYRLRRRDGLYRWVLDNGSPNFDHRGVFVGLIGSCIDISDQHEAENRLSQRAIKQAALAGFGRFALAQHPLSELTQEATRLICDTLRVEVSQVLALAPNSNALTVMAGTDRVTNAVSIDAPAGELAPNSLDVSLFALADSQERFPGRETHGSLGIAMGVAAPISSGKRPFGFLTVLSTRHQVFSRDSIDFIHGLANILGNVCQRERAQAALEESEQKLLQSQKMEAVGILAGGVAHDFNNLLTAIRCYGDLLSDDLAEAAPSLQPKAEEILKAAARASSLTRQLLAFSRKQILQPEILDLNAVVNDLKDLLRSLLSENVELNVQTTETPIYFEADRNQIDQVIINLCINARDAMPQGGTITLGIRSRTVAADNAHGLAAGEYVELRVSDTGVGINPDVQAHLFQPFFTTKPKGRGTGLGLATCAVIVKSCQGAIHFESRLGEGATFYVLLPQLPSIKFETAIVDEDSIGEGTESVLLVEDDEAIRTVTTAILETLGYRVHAVPGGIEALDLCSNKEAPHFDLLLTDIVMPNMDGRELAERILLLRPSLRIMFMSGYVGDPQILQAVQDAGARFLEKPFTRASLARKVRETLDTPSKSVSPAD